MSDDAQKAKDWSDTFARAPEARYDPAEAAEHGLTEGQYTDLYLKAFVLKKGQGRDPAALRSWLLDVKGHVQAAEHDRGYGDYNRNL